MFELAQDQTAGLISDLIQRNELIPLVAIVGGLLIGMVAVIFTSMRSMAVHKAREETKRELAAYVAEGSLDPDKAIAFLQADRSSCTKDLEELKGFVKSVT